MPNLQLIERHRRNYHLSSRLETKTFSFNLNESFSPDNFQKALSNSLAEMGQDFTRYFDHGLPADVAILFIDVCGFSVKYSHLEGEEIAEYFDRYYNEVIPLIYKYGGVVEKIIGDGIIALFGPPFLDESFDEVINSANKCAKAIIKKTIGSEFSSKVAFHAGTVNYFKNKTGLYYEFTMIGKPLTELFRLESIALDDCINYYGDSLISEWYSPKFANLNGKNSGRIDWSHNKTRIQNLKGVSYDHFYAVEFLE